jgi:hypothetical protein
MDIIGACIGVHIAVYITATGAATAAIVPMGIMATTRIARLVTTATVTGTIDVRMVGGYYRHLAIS